MTSVVWRKGEVSDCAMGVCCVGAMLEGLQKAVYNCKTARRVARLPSLDDEQVERRSWQLGALVVAAGTWA